MASARLEGVPKAKSSVCALPQRNYSSVLPTDAPIQLKETFSSLLGFALLQGPKRLMYVLTSVFSQFILTMSD